MNDLVVYLALVLVGVCMGSFAAATVWRLRARQLQADKKHKEPVDAKEFKKLKKLLGRNAANDRSVCLHCGYALKWHDLIPVVSWLSLRGKCRKCKTFIGWFEPLMEVGVAAFFVLSYLLWPNGLTFDPLSVTYFSLWLASGVVLAMLFAYDVKWYLLPDGLNLLLALFGAGMVAVTSVDAGNIAPVIDALGGVASIAGLYAILYFASGGRWVGFGDVKLGIGLGLILGNWQLGVLAVFLANFIGCLIVIPLLASKKIGRSARIPFGPMLIAGTVVAWFFGWQLINNYLLTIGL